MCFLFIVLYLSRTTSFVGNNCSFTYLFLLSIYAENFLQLHHKHPVFPLHLVNKEFLQCIDTVTGQKTDNLIGVDEMTAILNMGVTHELDGGHFVGFGLLGGLVVDLDGIYFTDTQFVLER